MASFLLDTMIKKASVKYGVKKLVLCHKHGFKPIGLKISENSG